MTRFVALAFAIVALSLTVGTTAGADDTSRAVLSRCTGCNLGDLDLRGRDLHDITLVGADLDRTDLRGANLRGAHFVGCHLRGTKLDGADLSGATFTGTSLDRVSFGNAILTDIKLVGIRITNQSHESPRNAKLFFHSCTGCDLSDAHFRDLDLSDVRLIGANLRGGDLQRTKFLRAHLVGADLDETDARNADLSDASLVGASFRNAHLEGASLRNASICYRQTWHEQNGVVSDSEKTVCADFFGAKLSGADLRGARYCEVDDRNCRPVTAEELRTLSHADLAGARLDE